MDENKVFITGWGQIENRLDPHHSQPKYQRLLEQLARFDLAKLRQVSTRIFSGMTPLSGGEAYTTDPNGIAFIRSGDFGYDGSIDFSGVIYLKPEIHQKLMRGSRLMKGDVLFAIVGATIGKVSHYSYEREANINQAVCGVRLKGDLEPEYISAFFQTTIGQQLIERTKRPVARANINLDEIGQLVFPRVDANTQEKVVQLLRDGYQKRQAKLDRVRALLTSIDDYLLAELGINLPPEPENIIANRIFTAQWRELSGWRFDPDMAVYSRHTRTSRFELSKLKAHMLAPPQYGANERGVQRVSKNVPRYVRITDVNEFGELSDGLGVAAEIADDKYLLAPGDLLFARSGNTVGKTYLHLGADDEQHIFAGYMIRFRLNPATLLPAFAFSYTLCRAYKEWCSAVQRAAGQPNINAEEYKSLLIPVPPIDKQAEIAAHVFEIREQAKHLRQQAETELESAKRRIEAMLLGEVTP